MKKNLIFSLCTVFCVITFTGCGTIKPYKKTVKSTPPGAGMTAAEAIAKMVTDNSAKLPNKSVAVVEFCDINGNANMFGSLLSERVTVITVQTSDIKVVERNLVKKILDEQKLSAFGLTESSNAKKIGGLLNVDAIVTGTVARFAGYYEINAKMISTADGLILAGITVKESAESAEKIRTQGINEAVGGKISEITGKAGSDLPKVEVLESSMEKSREGGLNESYGAITIKGTAKYIPSTTNPKAFRELISIFRVELFDDLGSKVMDFTPQVEGGKYGRAENVVPGEPFPFKAEDYMVRKDLWEKVSTYKVKGWAFLK